jgi:hypothetical protein
MAEAALSMVKFIQMHSGFLATKGKNVQAGRGGVSVIPAAQAWRQERDVEFKASLSCTVKICLKHTHRQKCSLVFNF